MNNEDPVTDSQDRESRREMLLKIGAALAAVTSVPLETKAQKKPPPGGDLQVRPEVLQRQDVARIPANIRTPFSAQAERQQFSVFFAHPRGKNASVLAIPASDQRSIREAASVLRGSPATATIVGGVIHIDLGRAAEGRCSIGGAFGVAGFGPGPGPVELGPIQRQ